MNTKVLAKRGEKVGEDYKYPNILMINFNMMDNLLRINLMGMVSI